MASQRVAELLAQMSPAEIEELRAGFGTTTEVDEYRRDIVAESVKEWEKRYGPIMGDVAKQTGLSKLTNGLSPEAARYIEDQFKDKPADHILALANDPTYSSMFRASAQTFADKAKAETEEATAPPKGEGAQPAVTADVEAFQKEMKSKMGVDFTEAEAKEALEEIKTQVPGQVVM